MRTKDSWNPAQYERFKAERKKPFDDLLARVARRPGMRIVDLGCGTGELTRELHQALSAQSTLGVDSSASMLEKAAPLAGGSLSFQQGDIAAFTSDSPFDLVFS